MAHNQVQFTWHAMERVAADGRLGKLTSYAQVQHVLVTKPLRNGIQSVEITTLDKAVRLADEKATNGYVQGNKVFAKVDVTNGDEVTVLTVTLGNTASKTGHNI